MQVHISAHMMVMHSAHNERKQETIVKILLENCGTSKKITLSLHGLHSLQSAVCSLQSAWSAFQYDRDRTDSPTIEEKVYLVSCPY